MKPNAGGPEPSDYKSERRERARDRERFQLLVHGRPEYMRLHVGTILRKKAVKRRAK